MDMADGRARAVLRAIFRAGVASADPRVCLPLYLPEKPLGRCVVVGAGKAAGAMAAALEAAWPEVELSGVVVTRYGQAVPTTRIRVLEAAHPVPDGGSVAAAREMLGAVQGLSEDDLVIALISGGGSALLALPGEGMTLAEKQGLNRELLGSGATIGEMNVVRKHVSGIKGGRLALAAQPARVVTLAISDVPGDDPALIASGPTVPDPSTWEDVDRIVARYGISLPAGIVRVETPKPGAFEVDYRMIATPLMALRAAAEVARGAGITPLILGDAIEGEAREMGIVMAGVARSVRAHGLPVAPPCVLLSGGEATVSLGRDAGQGGPNQEFAVALAVALKGAAGVWGLAADTDGIDGNSGAAGGLVGPDFLARAPGAEAALLRHDVAGVLRAADALLTPGPTMTNVNDLRAVLVL